jgi:hypothetical protein
MAGSGWTAGLIVVAPLGGISPGDAPRARLATFAAGLGGYPPLALVVSMAFGYDPADVARNLRLLVFALLLAAITRAVYSSKLVRGFETARISSGAVTATLAAGAGVVALFLAR